MNSPAGNIFPKYKSTNPLIRFAVERFLKTLQELVDELEVSTILEVGCGEGYLTNFLHQLKPGSEILGTDIDQKIIDQARQRYPHHDFTVADVENLPFGRKFDLVVACEVLEHVKNPERALAEIAQVTSKYALLSVPAEPLWRILNIIRGAYLKNLGNTPGHLHHWRLEQFKTTAKTYFQISKTTRPLPWTMILAETKEKKSQPQQSRRV